MSQVFGPVPSRRLGFSLGVDLVPFKTCTLDCIYCQLGRTTRKTLLRRSYMAPERIMADLKEVLSHRQGVDYITLSGSGEPTLHSQIGRIIEQIKEITDIPVAILTNGTLFTIKRRWLRSVCEGLPCWGNFAHFWESPGQRAGVHWMRALL